MRSLALGLVQFDKRLELLIASVEIAAAKGYSLLSFP